MRAQLALKNTIYLYLRTGFQAIISLFAVRIILNGLGQVDYGLYNTIGSIVVLSLFINSALSSATERYISFYLGREDYETLSKVYLLAVRLHRLIALGTFLLTEIVGYVFITYYMNVEDFRRPEMLIVLQFSLIALCLNILIVPYRAMLSSHERFDILSIITVIEAILKLGSAYLVLLFASHRIVIYAISIMVITLMAYVITKYKNMQYTHKLNKDIGYDKIMMKEMLSFSGWNFMGGFGFAMVNQVTNMVLNVFCGAVINAAQAIANNVSSYVAKFVADFMSAIHPQITKSFSAKDSTYLEGVVFSGIKLSFFLMYAVSIPLIFNLDFILTVWLKNPPEYVNAFIIVLLINSCVTALTGTISMLIEANAKIKYTQLSYTAVMVVCSVVAWILISKTHNPMFAYYSILVIGVLCLIIRLYFARLYKLIKLREYITTLVIYILPFTVTYYGVYMLAFVIFDIKGWQALFFSGIISALFLSLYGWFLFLSKRERCLVLNIVKKR